MGTSTNNTTTSDRRSLPDGWRWVRLEEICDFRSGGTPSKADADLWSGDIPWISPKDMKTDKIEDSIDHISLHAVESSATRMVEVGAILCVARSGILAHTFPVALVKRTVAFNQDIRALIPNPDYVDSNYLQFALRDAEQVVLTNGVKKGPTVHSIKSGFLETFQLPLPPLPTQRAIVRRLDRDMAEVARLRAAVQRQRAAVAALPAAYLREVFEGEEARGWEHVPIGEVCSVVEGQVDPRLPEYRELPHINGEVIESGTGRLLPYRTAADDQLISGKYLFQPGSVIFSKLRPYLRKVAYVDFRGLCSADAYPLTAKVQFLHPFWLKWVLLSNEFSNYAIEESLRSRMPKLNREQLLHWKMPLPDLANQGRVAQMLESRIEQIDTLRRQAERQRAAIEALPAALLREVFGGFAE